jgi:hypothetical protein
MKIIYLISTLLLVGLATEAQVTPRSEFTIQLSKNLLEVKAGTSTEFTVTISRSKTYTRSKGKLGFSSALPEGVSITFEPAEGLFESSIATLTLDQKVKPGQYQIIVNAELNRTRKGSVLKLVVPERKGNEIVTVNE